MVERDRNVRIANSGAAINALSKLGIKVDTGCNEFLDNSRDAAAKKIQVDIQDHDEFWKVINADNGCGIPLVCPSSGNPGIVQAVRYAGRIPLPTGRQPTGRFGFGLTQTAFCLSERTIVYSKVKGGTWRRVVLDKSRLRENAGRIDLGDLEDYVEDAGIPPKEHQPPNWVEPESGTIIVLERIENPRFRSMRSLIKNMRKQIGRIHRYGIEEGLEIHLTPTFDDDESIIIARDPLLMLPSSYDCQHFGPPKEGPKTGNITLDGVDYRGEEEIIDPSTGRPAKIEISYILADADKISEAVNAKKESGTIWQRRLAEHWFNQSGQGFSIVRGDRELAFGEDLSIFQKNSNFNYFRGEIRFPIIQGDTRLDDLFGVQTMKSSIDIDPRLIEKLRTNLQRPIEKLRSTHLKARRKITAAKRKSLASKAESSSGSLRKHAPRPKRDEKTLEGLQKQFNEHKKQVIKREDIRADTLLTSASQKLSTAEVSGDNKRIEQAKVELQNAAKTASSIKNTVRNRFAFTPGKEGAPMFMIEIESLHGTDDLYIIKDFHDPIVIVLNDTTAFFEEIYEIAAMRDSEEKSLLDLILFSIALSEANLLHSSETREFWKGARTKISRFSNLLISALDEVFEEEEKPEDGLVRMAGDTKARCSMRISKYIDVEMYELRDNNRGGSTVPKTWLVEVATKLGVETDGAQKQELVRRILRQYERSIDEKEYFATGSTVQLSALQVIEDIITNLANPLTIDLSKTMPEAQFDAMIRFAIEQEDDDD